MTLMLQDSLARIYRFRSVAQRYFLLSGYCLFLSIIQINQPHFARCRAKMVCIIRVAQPLSVGTISISAGAGGHPVPAHPVFV